MPKPILFGLVGGAWRAEFYFRIAQALPGQFRLAGRYYHKGYSAGGQEWYQNPFAHGRLSDDEIAVATCLRSMGRYLDTGESFYSLAEASQDHYLSLMMDEATRSGRILESSNQVWR